MVVYCEFCKCSPCGHKAIQLFPEDKVSWAIFEKGILTHMVCDTHKLMLENMNKTWKINEVEFVKVKQ